MARVEQIPTENLKHVPETRKTVTELTEAANQATTHAKLAELEFRVELQQVYINNGLSGSCVVDIFAGNVRWPENDTTEGRVELLSKDKLERVQAAHAKLSELTKTAESAVTKARLAELEFRVELQQIYIDNGLNGGCVVDVFTGAVKWQDPPATVAAPAQPVETPKKVRTYRRRATNVEPVVTPAQSVVHEIAAALEAADVTDTADVAEDEAKEEQE
jgi:uncharacterized coiled-coil protein SlyX